MDDWTTAPLDHFLTRTTYGFTNPMPTTDAGPYMVTARDINGGRILYESARRTSDEAYRSDITDKSRPEIGDVLVTKDGTLGRMAIVDQPNVCINQSVALLKPKETIRPRFLKYLLEEPRNFARMLGDADGTTIKHIYITRLAKMEVSVPSVGYQDRVLGVLASLDDKIDLNRRMNETLEEMARALFRDWFVDFGPTRRQIEGATDPAAIMGQAFPTEKAVTYAPLFPTKLSDDGLPEGWEEQPYEAFVEIIGGGTPKTKNADYWGGKIPWFSVVDAPSNGGVYILSTEKHITQAGLDNSSARMVPEGTTIISARGTVGKIGMAPHDMTFNQSCYALRPRDPVGERFVYLATERLVERLQAMAHGSVFSTITRTTFASLNFAGATDCCFEAFEDVTEPLFAKIKANGEENQTLASLRDLLLPKLMSGEIRLKDAEGAV